MSKEITSKAMKFCRLYQANEFTDAVTAYRQAYQTPDDTSLATSRSAASRLLAKDEVKQHLKELEAIVLKRHRTSISSLLKDLDESKSRCIKAKNEKGVVSAIMATVRLQGQSDGELLTFSYKQSKTIQDTIDTLNAAQDDYGEGLISSAQLSQIRETQKSIASSLEKQELEKLADRLALLEEQAK